MINTPTTIQTNPASKLINTHKYPHLRQDVYQAIINYINNKLTNDTKFTREQLLELRIDGLSLSEQMTNIMKPNTKTEQDATRYLEEMKYAILLNDVKYLQKLPADNLNNSLQEITKNIQQFHIDIFKNSANVHQNNPHSYKSPSQSLKIILLNNGLVYVGPHKANLIPDGRGLLVDANGCKYSGKFKDGVIDSNASLMVHFPDGSIYKNTNTFNQKSTTNHAFICQLFNQHINSGGYNTQDIIDIIKTAPQKAKVYLKNNEIIVHYTDYEKYTIPTKLTEVELLSNGNFHEVDNSGMSDNKNEKIFCLTDRVYFTDDMENGFVFPGGVNKFKEYLTKEMKHIISESANKSDGKTKEIREMKDKYSKLDTFRDYGIKDKMQKIEQFAKTEGILNCGEFTPFTTQLFIKYLNTLEPEMQQNFYNQYEIENGELDNEMDEENNHDHTMLFVVDKNSRKQVCVIDAWLIAKYPHQIFIGTGDEYFKLLQVSVDGEYVKKGISKEHIQTYKSNPLDAFKLTKDKFHAVTIFEPKFEDDRTLSNDEVDKQMLDEVERELKESNKPNGLWVILTPDDTKCFLVNGKAPNRTKYELTIKDENKPFSLAIFKSMGPEKRWSNEALRECFIIPENTPIKTTYRKPKIIHKYSGVRLDEKMKTNEPQLL